MMKAERFTVVFAAMCATTIALSAQSTAITIVLTGQSMIRSDLRTTKPAALPAIKALLNGDVIFTNLEAAVAEPGETIQEGRGFLTPPEALDALTAMGFNLLALSGNHAFDLKEAGIRNTLRELDRRHIVHAGTGNNIAEAAAASVSPDPEGNDCADRERVRPDCAGRARHRGAAWSQRASRGSRQSRKRGDRRFARRAGEHAES